MLYFHGSIFVRKINEVALVEIKKLEVISGLNSISLRETTYRLELYHNLAIDDDIGSDVANVLALIKYRDYAFGFVGDDAIP